MDIQAQRDHKGARVLKLFYGDEAEGKRHQIQFASTQQAHDLEVPVKATVMLLACFLQRMSIKAFVEWAPPTTGRRARKRHHLQVQPFQADRFSGVGDTGIHFHRLCRRDARWNVSAGEFPDRTRAQTRRRPEDKMRVRDSWQSQQKSPSRLRPERWQVQG